MVFVSKIHELVFNTELRARFHAGEDTIISLVPALVSVHSPTEDILIELVSLIADICSHTFLGDEILGSSSIFLYA